MPRACCGPVVSTLAMRGTLRVRMEVRNRCDEAARHGHYADARENLDDSLAMLSNAADIYEHADDPNRRLLNQALFTTIQVDEDNDVRVGYRNPHDGLSVPGLHADALRWAAEAKNIGLADPATKGELSVASSHLTRLGSLRSTFVNFAPRLNTLVTRWKRGVYRVAQRPGNGTIRDSCGPVVRKIDQLYGSGSRDESSRCSVRYTSRSRNFDAELTVDREGMVVDYPTLAQRFTEG